MQYEYGEFDGQSFQAPDDLFPNPQVMNFILQYGDQALDAMQQLDNEQEQQFVQQMIDAGMLEKYEDDQGNARLRLTPKMLKGLQHKAMEEMFADLRKGNREGHRTPASGRTTERLEGTKAYEFGDPISELNLGATMQNALARQLAQRGDTGAGAAGAALPIGVTPGDFELHLTEGMADCATVMLIDLSGSMMRFGRFYQAKRVALGMQAMLSAKFPQDTLDYVGFYSLADRLYEKDIPLVMPKPVSIRDYQVRIRVPLDQAYDQKDRLPLHFTNLQLGLRKARQILQRSGAANKQIFVVTDGQPTAHVAPNAGLDPGDLGSGGGGGEMLYLMYPPTEETATVTLKEAMRCQQQGIRIATFALIEDYWGMDWVGFVEKLTRLTRGIAYYCTSEDLSSTVIESYLTGKKKKTFIH